MVYGRRSFDLLIIGNHWFPNDSSYVDNPVEFEIGMREFYSLWANQDAEGIAIKHTEDSIYIHQELGILRGREGKRTH